MIRLLELGSDPFLPNVEGTTSLIVAAGLGRTAPLDEAGTEDRGAGSDLQLLLELDADINAVDDHGGTVRKRRGIRKLPDGCSVACGKAGLTPEIWRQPIQARMLAASLIAEGYRSGLLQTRARDNRIAYVVFHGHCIKFNTGAQTTAHRPGREGTPRCSKTTVGSRGKLPVQRMRTRPRGRMLSTPMNSQVVTREPDHPIMREGPLSRLGPRVRNRHIPSVCYRGFADTKVILNIITLYN